MQINNYISFDYLLGFCRIAFGLIFILKFYFSFKARKLVWSHDTPFGATDEAPFIIISSILFLSIVFFTIGLYTGPAVLCMYLSYLLLYKYASLFGLEDVSFQHLNFYFLMANSGKAFSLDSYLGIYVWGRLGDENGYLPEIFLAAAIGILFLSAGMEKLYSPMWRKGLGGYYFYLLPQFRRIDTSFITSREWLSRGLGWMAIIMEIGILPALIFNCIPLGLIFWLLGFGFTFSLSTIFILTWIGECLSIAMVIILYLILVAWSQGLLGMLLNENFNLDLSEQVILIGVAISFIATFVTATVRNEIVKHHLLLKIYKIIRYISRFTWGLLPLRVFTELHVEGPIVYRLFYKLNNNKESEILRIFSENCTPGAERPFRPAFYEVTSYKVAEACMEFDTYGKIKTNERAKFIQMLCEYALSRLNVNERRDVDMMRFSIKQIVKPENFQGAVAEYLNRPWIDAFEVKISEGKAGSILPLKQKILDYPTGRDLNRVSFRFNPGSA